MIRQAMSQENLPLGFLTRSDTNRAVQPQKMARGLKFRMSEEDLLFFVALHRSQQFFSHFGTASLV